MKGFIIFLLIISALSCSNLSLETDSIIVEVLNNGHVLSTGDFFDITFRKSSESVVVQPTSADVTIEYITDESSFKSIGSVVEPLEVYIDILETPNPQFQITSDFQEGLYSIDVTVFENDDVISEYNSEFIVYSGILSGEVSTVYPLDNIYTDSKVILESQIIHDDYIDPYLIWSIDDEIISEGYLSDGYNSIIWDTEQRYGFMDINLNLFPYKLNDVTSSSENVVDFSFVINPLDSDLYNAELLSRYSKLLYFNGNYIDEIDRYLHIDKYGDPSPKLFNLFYGMEIGEELGFITYDSIIPVDVETGLLMSFSMIIDIQPLGLVGGSIFNNNHGDLISNLFIEDGIIKHRFSSNGVDFEIVEIVEVNLESSSNIVVSFVKISEGYNLFYYIDGELITTGLWLIPESYISDEQSDNYSFEVGGSTQTIGFSAIIDNIKIYNKDSSGNNNVYSDLNSDFLGHDSYVLVDGFNSIYNPLNFVGTGFSDGETLTMGSGSHITYQDILPIDKDYIFTIECESSQYILRIFADEENSYEELLSGDVSIKKRGTNLFVDDKMIELWDNNRNDFTITAVDITTLDALTIVSMDRIIETE